MPEFLDNPHVAGWAANIANVHVPYGTYSQTVFGRLRPLLGGVFGSDCIAEVAALTEGTLTQSARKELHRILNVHAVAASLTEKAYLGARMRHAFHPSADGWQPDPSLIPHLDTLAAALTNLEPGQALSLPLTTAGHLSGLRVARVGHLENSFLEFQVFTGTPNNVRVNTAIPSSLNKEQCKSALWDLYSKSSVANSYDFSELAKFGESLRAPGKESLAYAVTDRQDAQRMGNCWALNPWASFISAVSADTGCGLKTAKAFLEAASSYTIRAISVHAKEFSDKERLEVIHHLEQLPRTIEERLITDTLVEPAPSGPYAPPEPRRSAPAATSARAEPVSSMALLQAVEDRDHNSVRGLLSRGANKYVNTAVPYPDGKTPLYVAANNGDLHIVDELLAAGANVNGLAGGATPLYAAAASGRVDMVSALIARGANIDAGIPSSGAAPLHAAALRNQTEVERVLIENGANVNARKQNGETPLHIVVSEGRLAAAKAMIDRGADVNAKNGSGNTPLDLAKARSHTDLIAELSQPRGRVGSMDLVKAVHEGNRISVANLLARGAGQYVNTAVPYPNGETPLYVAASNGRADIVGDLLGAGADVNRKVNGATPLYAAAGNGHVEVASALIRRGADVNATIENGATPLHIAALFGHTGLMTVLIQNGADVNAIKQNGETPLHIAAAEGNLPAVRALMQAHATVSVQRSDGKTAIELAKERGHSAVADALKLQKPAPLTPGFQNAAVESRPPMDRFPRGMSKAIG